MSGSAPRGQIVTLVLRALYLREMCGVDIANLLVDQGLDLSEGSVYAILRGLERAGLAIGIWSMLASSSLGGATTALRRRVRPRLRDRARNARGWLPRRSRLEVLGRERVDSVGSAAVQGRVRAAGPRASPSSRHVRIRDSCRASPFNRGSDRSARGTVYPALRRLERRALHPATG